MAMDKYTDVGVITEVTAGEEGDEFAGTNGKPNKIVMTVARLKYPCTVGWWENEELLEPLQELAMSGERVKCTYILTDPSGPENRRYRNLIRVETANGAVIEVPDAEDGFMPGAGGGGGSTTIVGGGGPIEQRLAALSIAATILAPQGAFTGKGGDLPLCESLARSVLEIVGADPKVAEGFVEPPF
jgi:hypothetical protein